MAPSLLSKIQKTEQNKLGHRVLNKKICCEYKYPAKGRLVKSMKTKKTTKNKKKHVGEKLHTYSVRLTQC
jgi:hypothetical protein